MASSSSAILSAILVLTLLCFITPAVSSSSKVSVSLYYETLCPYCSNYIVNNLAKLFQNGLISIVDLNLVPYGNARVTTDGSLVCQHGSGECLLNAIEACAIKIWLDVQQHFPFIQCIENSVLMGEENSWQSCFQVTGLSPQPVIDCYNSGSGLQLEKQFAEETDSLQPPHQFVPWVVVNGKPLYGNYTNYQDYVCKAYDGVLPDVCREQKLNLFQETEAIKRDKVCLASEITN